MTEHFSVTPPQWQLDAWEARIEAMAAPVSFILLEVAQWGADQELEACCEVLQGWRYCRVEDLRTARGPKPPSLKELALEDLKILIDDLASHGMGFKATNIRRALDALPDD